jgi:hypothetical protein
MTSAISTQEYSITIQVNTFSMWLTNPQTYKEPLGLFSDPDLKRFNITRYEIKPVDETENFPDDISKIVLKELDKSTNPYYKFWNDNQMNQDQTKSPVYLFLSNPENRKQKKYFLSIISSTKIDANDFIKSITNIMSGKYKTGNIKRPAKTLNGIIQILPFKSGTSKPATAVAPPSNAVAPPSNLVVPSSNPVAAVVNGQYKKGVYYSKDNKISGSKELVELYELRTLLKNETNPKKKISIQKTIDEKSLLLSDKEKGML